MAEVKIMQRCVYVSNRTKQRCTRYTQDINFLCCNHTELRTEKTAIRMKAYRINKTLKELQSKEYVKQRSPVSPQLTANTGPPTNVNSILPFSSIPAIAGL